MKYSHLWVLGVCLLGITMSPTKASENVDAEESVRVYFKENNVFEIYFVAGDAGNSPLPKGQLEIREPAISNRTSKGERSSKEKAAQLIDNINYYTKVEPRNFAIRADDNVRNNGKRGYRFCVDFGTSINHMTCSITFLKPAKVDILELLNEAGIDFQVFEFEDEQSVDSTDSSLKSAISLMTSLNDDDAPPAEDDPTESPESWARHVLRMLEILCGSGVFCDYGVTSTYRPATGVWETHGYYTGYPDGTSDSYYMPHPFMEPSEYIYSSPPGGSPVISIP